MRSILTVSASLTLMFLAGCGQSGAEGQTGSGEVTPAQADAAAGGEPGAVTSGEDVRGTTGTAPPDGAGKPGTTLPTVAPGTPEAGNSSAPASSTSN